MANQAWFEYQPARVAVRASRSLERFQAPPVKDAPIEQFDEHGLGREPNNLAAIESLRAYRTLRWGRLLDLIISDQYSHRSEDPSTRPEARMLALPAFPEMLPEEVMRTLDAGAADANGHPPGVLMSSGAPVPNYRKAAPSPTLLGACTAPWVLVLPCR